MQARRVVIWAFCFNLLAVTATAETIVIRPDPCPVAAGAPRLIDPGDVAAADLNPDRAAASGVVVFYPVSADGWASERLLARFDFEAPDRAPLAGCASARGLFVR